MNDLETLLQLVMLLAKYGNSVIVHDVFRDELADLLAKSGSEDKFFKRLASYIQQLVENGEAAIGPPGAPIEHLAGQKNLCAMRFKLEISNLRVFFVYKDGLIYLLSSFYERQGHKNTEYSTHTPIAKTRFAELMEGE